MIRKFCLTLAVISTALFTIVSAQQTAKITASGIGYLEYLPQGYHSNSNKYPLVISLHGVKEKGTSSTDPKRVLPDLQRVDNVGLPKYAKYGTKYPFILISPQLKSKYGSWPASYVMEVLSYVKKHLRVDEHRIYLTGLSLGGLGVWRTVGDYPDVWAAIVPICAGGNALNKANDIAAANVPVWGFHGDRDRIVHYSVTTRMINALNSAPKRPNPLAKATIFPRMDHGIWDKVYNETNAINWMLSHRKGSPSNHDGDHDDDEDEEDDNDGEDDDDDGEDEDDDGEDDEEKPEEANKLPVARAGADRTLTLPANSLDVEGKGEDADGKIISYQWAKISGGSASLSGDTSPTLRASNLSEGSYVFRLTVRDDRGASSHDDMLVHVNKSDEKTDDKEPSTKNLLPVVYAGPDLTLTLPANSVSIQARASDKDGKVVSYEWAKTYGRNASFSGANTSSVRIFNLTPGIYIFKVRATDNDGGVKDDYFKITVKEAEKGNQAPDGNKNNMIPVAYAGPDRVLTWPTNSLTIHAQASDKDGKIVSYQWTKTYGKRASLSGDRTSTVRISNLAPGVYIFRLAVTDDDGAVKNDYFKITVKNPANGTAAH